MEYELTAAVLRSLATASAWRGRNGGESVQPAQLLVGLLLESECRAARMLETRGVSLATVRQHWPDLEPSESRCVESGERSAIVRQIIAAAAARLPDWPRPLTIATEHMLLGLLVMDHEVAAWLAERGLDARELTAELYRLSGVEAGPLPVDGDRLAASGTPADELVAVLRIVDAAENRAREGLRVVEDYLRFVLDDPLLTRLAKDLRHRLAAAFAGLAHGDRLSSRETQADVGRHIAADSERSRQGLFGVLTPNCKRIQEALRSLEEYAKTFAPELAADLEAIRYDSYSLERAIDSTRTSLERLAKVRLYVLIDGRDTLENFRGTVQALVDAGVGALQLRDKKLLDRELLERARALVGATRGSDTLAIVNDRPDIAALSRADGVHVGQSELSVKDARTILGPRGLVGVSTHSIQQARDAVLDGASYIGVGPTFPSSTKQFEAFGGVELLRAVSQEIRLPAFAIGGITAENLPQVLAAGCSRIAVSGAILSAADPARTAGELLAILNGSAQSQPDG